MEKKLYTLKHSKICNLISENHDSTKAARLLLDCIVKDIQIAKMCTNCYLNWSQHPDDWFSMVCDDPHLIVWVKKTGANFWPAKLTSVTDQEVNVCLFGDHSQSTVSANSCLLYSESSPSRIPKPPDAYNEALRVSTFGLDAADIRKNKILYIKNSAILF